MECGRPIHACFGYVMAGDFVEWLEGKRFSRDIRERCGICIERIQGTLDELEKQHEDH